MRRTLGLTVAVLLLCVGHVEAQSCDGCGIGYRPSSVSSSGGTLTGPLVLPNGTQELPSLRFGDPDTGIWALANGYVTFSSNAQRVFLLSTTSAEFGTPVTGSPTDTQPLGFTNRAFTTAMLTRGIQGSKSLNLTDNTKAAFVKVDVAAGSYGGGDVIWTIYCADAADRVSRSGRVPFAVQNTGSTETCATGTSSSSGDVTNNAKSFAAVTFTCADGGTDQIQLEVQADCTITTPTTLTIEYRMDMPTMRTVTPGT